MEALFLDEYLARDKLFNFIRGIAAEALKFCHGGFGRIPGNGRMSGYHTHKTTIAADHRRGVY